VGGWHPPGCRAAWGVTRPADAVARHPLDEPPWVWDGGRVDAERPGFGASTRLPGRRFREHADDLAELLDHLGLDSVFAVGVSGAAPHVLALCVYHPDRVRAASVVGGIAPLTDADCEGLHPELTKTRDRLRSGRLAEEAADLDGFREMVLADPAAPFAAYMADAPPPDQAVLSDPVFRATLARSMTEALAPGTGGWLDEEVATDAEWDVDPTQVPTSLTWFHARDDANTPIGPARRLVAELPRGKFVEWRDAGHLSGYTRAAEVLDDLLGRG